MGYLLVGVHVLIVSAAEEKMPTCMGSTNRSLGYGTDVTSSCSITNCDVEVRSAQPLCVQGMSWGHLLAEGVHAARTLVSCHNKVSDLCHKLINFVDFTWAHVGVLKSPLNFVQDVLPRLYILNRLDIRSCVIHVNLDADEIVADFDVVLPSGGLQELQMPSHDSMAQIGLFL